MHSTSSNKQSMVKQESSWPAWKLDSKLKLKYKDI